ncbi:hypothetical protein EOM60_04685 [Candidatus Saccharibacteria bacterium]|nr:hypothetical protein [Candidatus Saccharibacteria bacterium]
MAKLYGDVHAALLNAKGSLVEVRKVFALMQRAAERLETNGHKAEAKAMRAKADNLFSSVVRTTGGAAKLLSEADVKAELKRSAKEVKRLEKRLSRVEGRISGVESAIDPILHGRPDRFDPNTGRLVQHSIPPYPEAMEQVMYGTPAQYDATNGRLVQAARPGLYEMGDRFHANRNNWLASIITFVVVIGIGLFLGAKYNWGFASLATPGVIIVALVFAALAAGIPPRNHNRNHN